MSIFDQYISVYNGVTDNVGATTLLGNFLRSKRHISRILDLRRETDERRKKAIKLSLPSGTASGWFAPERKIEYLQRHSGFICIDIDGKDNPDHTMEDVRGLLVSRDDVAYAALSVGGKGMFALLPLAWPDRHEEQFDALKLDFKEQYGITLDKACRDVTRLRVLSYDENPYVNEDAKRYEGIEVFTPNFAQPSLVGEDGDLRKVQRCVDQIVEFGIDITQTYQDWYTIGAALASLISAAVQSVILAIVMRSSKEVFKAPSSKILSNSFSQVNRSSILYLAGRWLNKCKGPLDFHTFLPS